MSDRVLGGGTTEPPYPGNAYGRWWRKRDTCRYVLANLDAAMELIQSASAQCRSARMSRTTLDTLVGDVLRVSEDWSAIQSDIEERQ